MKGKFKSLNDLSKTIKVPHVGWNECIIKKSNLFKGSRINLILFTHTYYLDEHDRSDIISETNYQINFIIYSKHNIYGVQFHRKKSKKWVTASRKFFSYC